MRSPTDVADDKRYILNYAAWNMWPFCPVVARYPHKRQTGYLYIDQETADLLKEGKVRIHIGNTFMANPETDLVKNYDSFEAFFNDGWEVD